MYKKAAMVGGGAGAVMGILSIIPIISCLNCLLIFVPGALTVFLGKQAGEELSMGSGAGAGAVAGLCSTVISAIIGIPLMLLLGAGQLQQAMQQMGPDVAVGGGMLVVFMLIGVVISAVVSSAINAITGLIAVAVLNR